MSVKIAAASTTVRDPLATSNMLCVCRSARWTISA